MLVDTRTLQPGTAQADLCIIGSGAAGIALALEFADTPVQVILVESGGLKAEPDGQGIYEVVADPVPRLTIDASRVRSFGGNTNYWAGNCCPLDDYDFERRDWIPYSGWPIRRCDLLPYYERAQAVCGLSDFRWYDLETCRPHLHHPPLHVDPATLVSRVLQQCSVKSFVDLHRRRLEAIDNVQVWLHTHAVCLKSNATRNQVLAVETSTTDGRRSWIESGMVILAGGGIENARLLLSSDDGTGNGLGNNHDLVGRFFMEHWYVDIPLDGWGKTVDVALYHGRQPVGGASVWCQLVLSETLMRSERLPGLSLWLQPTAPEALSIVAARRLLASLRGRAPLQPVTDLRLALDGSGQLVAHILHKLSGRDDTRTTPEGYALRVQLEQMPNPQNRIRLSTQRDRFGQQRPELVLRLDADEQARYAKGLRIATAGLGLNSRSLARQLELMVRAGQLGFFWHHMGTTRMHSDSTYGVVDGDCRVHGVSNLFIAGSSVFPTGGTASPTLTIVALALRLAAHLQQRLAT